MAKISRRGVVRVVSFSLAVAVLSLGAAVYQMQRARSFERQVTASYQRSFAEMVDYVANIESSLEKTRYVTTPVQLMSLSSEIWRQSGAAKASLSQLPLSETNLEQLSRFLTQVGDYVYSLSKRVVAGQEITEEERTNLMKFEEYAASLSQTLIGMQQDISQGSVQLISADNRSFAGGQDLPTLSQGLSELQESFAEYPMLIYDGPFSDHISKQTSVMLEGAAEVSQEEAARRAAEALMVDASALEFQGEGNGTIPEYSFYGGDRYIEITKAGGYVKTLQNSRQVSDVTISAEQGVKYAEEYLRNHGYDSMVYSYYMVENNIITVNFSYSQDGVVCYPDLIKVGIAMDNGELMVFENTGYLMSHQDARDLPAPSVSEEGARSAVSGLLTIESGRLAVIPSDGMYERFCYEFKCTNDDGQSYLVYVNAETGIEEKILILLDTPGGTLTM